MQARTINREWWRTVLIAAALYNMLWGCHAVLFPGVFWELVGIPPPNYLFLWQCIGMIVGVYGIGYGIAAQDPNRHWPIVLVGFLGKIFGPLGFLWTLWKGDLPLSFGLVIITNDLVWLPFFFLILRGVYRDALTEQAAPHSTTFQEVVNSFRFSNGATLAEMSAGRSVAVLFVRHLGCTFCREAIALIVRQREQLRAAGVSVVVVHMNEPGKFAEFARERGIADIPALSDPSRSVYRAFNLARGTLMQLFGPKVWFGALRAYRYGVGLLEGDGFQMPGAFLIREGQIVREFRHPHAAATVDLCEFATGQG